MAFLRIGNEHKWFSKKESEMKLLKYEKPISWTLALEFLRVNELHFVYNPFSIKKE